MWKIPGGSEPGLEPTDMRAATRSEQMALAGDYIGTLAYRMCYHISHIPTQSKATQLVVAQAVWATQRSDSDFNLSILLLSASEQCYITMH
jgi:hypothetical protein